MPVIRPTFRPSLFLAQNYRAIRLAVSPNLSKVNLGVCGANKYIRRRKLRKSNLYIFKGPAKCGALETLAEPLSPIRTPMLGYHS